MADAGVDWLLTTNYRAKDDDDKNKIGENSSEIKIKKKGKPFKTKIHFKLGSQRNRSQIRTVSWLPKYYQHDLLVRQDCVLCLLCKEESHLHRDLGVSINRRR